LTVPLRIDEGRNLIRFPLRDTTRHLRPAEFRIQIAQNAGVQSARDRHLNLINRSVIPFVETLEVPDASGKMRRKSGFGDIVLASVTAPNKAKGFLWGLGPTWQFPSAGTDFTGSGKRSATRKKSMSERDALEVFGRRVFGPD